MLIPQPAGAVVHAVDINVRIVPPGRWADAVPGQSKKAWPGCGQRVAAATTAYWTDVRLRRCPWFPSARHPWTLALRVRDSSASHASANRSPGGCIGNLLVTAVSAGAAGRRAP
jgi:hypothetical protein